MSWSEKDFEGQALFQLGFDSKQNVTLLSKEQIEEVYSQKLLEIDSRHISNTRTYSLNSNPCQYSKMRLAEMKNLLLKKSGDIKNDTEILHT